MKKINLAQLCDDIRRHHASITQKSLRLNIKFMEIPDDDVDILFAYFGIHLVCELYGGNFKKQVRAFNARLKVKESFEAAGNNFEDDESLYEPTEPSGIGGWQYADRMKQKVFKALEGIINQTAASVSHNQYVSAAKTLLEQAEKTKVDSAEIMMAYQSQLLILAEHLVEIFLPKLGQQIKKEFRDAEKEVIKKITEAVGPNDPGLKIWKAEIDRMIRGFELKRYELILAETMVSNRQVSEAFDFTRDLIDNYKTTAEIDIEEKGVTKLKQFIGKRAK